MNGAQFMNASCRSVQTPAFAHLLLGAETQERPVRFRKQTVRTRHFFFAAFAAGKPRARAGARCGDRESRRQYPKWSRGDSLRSEWIFLQKLAHQGQSG